MDGLRGAITLLIIIAKQNLSVASSKIRAALSPAGPPPMMITSIFIPTTSCPTYMGRFQRLGTPSACWFLGTWE
jgi:hypothetical protein